MHSTEQFVGIIFIEYKKYSAHTNLANKKKEVNSMSDISELDLQNLRHLIGGFDTTHCKMQEYAKEAEDPKVKQFLKGCSQRDGEQTAAYEVLQ